jgi:hypothetical protein
VGKAVRVYTFKDDFGTTIYSTTGKYNHDDLPCWEVISNSKHIKERRYLLVNFQEENSPDLFTYFSDLGEAILMLVENG